jgi:ribose/xylose/arabinose/galactoside ABC-type transport system permease subunit
MKLFFYFLFIIALFVIVEKIFVAATKGDLFKPGGLKKHFRSLGKDLWLGARLFVILWFLYLIFIWLVRNKFN